MTESNVGLIHNKAEILKSYNNLGIEDKDSKSESNQNGEGDFGTADVIISVSTGAIISYTAVTLSIVIIIGLLTYAVCKKILKNSEIL